MTEANALAEDLWDLIMDHHALRANLMGLRDDGALQDHSEEADQVYLRRYRAIAEEAGRMPQADPVTRALIQHLAQAECDTIESRSIEFGVSGYLQAAVPELLYFLPELKSHQAVPRVLAAQKRRAE